LVRKRIDPGERTASSESRTDWDRIARMRDEDIDFSDIPEMTEEQFAKAVVRKGGTGTKVSRRT
jgi:hypothetical protein